MDGCLVLVLQFIILSLVVYLFMCLLCFNITCSMPVFESAPTNTMVHYIMFLSGVI